MKAGAILAVLACLAAVVSPPPILALEPEQDQEREQAREQQDPAETGEADKEPGDEDQPKKPVGKTETVKVTATRVETELMKTPVAVSVFDQETLDREGIKNVRDMAQMVPNMDIATINGQSTPIISLRGVRSTNETELGDPSVGVHLDGIYSPRMQGILGLMFDNERVEVLRGPQGTLFGRNSTVGSINIISAKPKLDKFDSNLTVQYGNYNAPELQAMVNKPLSDTWAVRFAGRYSQRDSYLSGYWDPNQYDQRFLNGIITDPTVIAPGSFEDCTSPDCQTVTQHTNWWVSDTGDSIYALQPADDDDFYMDSKEWAYRASARWQPWNKDMSLNLSFQHYRTDSSGGIDLVNCDKLRGRPTYELSGAGELVLDDDGNPIVTGRQDCSTIFPEDNTYQAVVNTPGRFYLDIKYLRSQFTWDLKDNLRFVYLLGLEDQDRESAQDMEQSLNAWDQAMFFLPGTGSTSGMTEFQFQSRGKTAFNWIAGGNFFREKTSTIGFFDNALDEKAYWDQPNRSTTASAIFAQGTYSYSPQWHLTMGARYSAETKQDKGGQTYLCSPGNFCAVDLVGYEQIQNVPRFDRDGLNAASPDLFTDPSFYPDVQRNDNKGSWNHTDWRIGLDYQMNDDILIYSYLATGFKAGGIGDVFEGTVIDGDVTPDGLPYIVSEENVVIRTEYDPEEVTTLELGFKQRLLDGKLELRGAYFFSDYENMQYASVGSLAFTERFGRVFDQNGDPIDLDGDGSCCDVFDRAWQLEPLITAYFTQNVPGAKIQGIELEYDTRPWQGGRIRGYASWLDTEINDDWITKWDYDPVSYFAIDYASSVDASNERLQVNLRGNDLAVSPPFKVHMTVDHAFLLEKSKRTVVPWVTLHWEDDSYLTVWNVDRHAGNALFNPCPEQDPGAVPDGCLEFVILPQDIQYTDDKREAWSMVHAGVALYSGDWKAEIYGYNLTDEVVQWWGGAAERVPKGSLSTPRTYGLRIGYQF